MQTQLIKDLVDVQKKPKCNNCKKDLDHRIPRPKIMKVLAPWLKVKRYKCVNCLKISYKLY